MDDFPSNPTIGQKANGLEWDGSKWISVWPAFINSSDYVIKSDVNEQIVEGPLAALSFKGDGTALSGITMDQLADVNSASAAKDQFLIFDGSSWVAGDGAGIGGGSGNGSEVPSGSAVGDTVSWNGSAWSASAQLCVLPEGVTSIGTTDYTAKTYIHGDVYLGMSESFYNTPIRHNPDTWPGTTFCGGMAMVGSYIEGSDLNAQNPEEEADKRLIRLRSFEKDAALDMTDNPIYGLCDPDVAQWASLRSQMPPTMDWVERKLVGIGSGGTVAAPKIVVGATGTDPNTLYFVV